MGDDVSLETVRNKAIEAESDENRCNGGIVRPWGRCRSRQVGQGRFGRVGRVGIQVAIRRWVIGWRAEERGW